MDTKAKNIIIGALLAAVAIMAVGYAALAQTLKINGTASITSTWNVAITGISSGVATGTATNGSEPSFTGTSATFNVNLVKPGDKWYMKLLLKTLEH